MPFLARAKPPAPQLVRIRLPKLATPLPNGFVANGEATVEQQFLYVPATPAKAKVESHGMADDFDRQAMIVIELD
jgi:hypothetical protein